MATCLRYPGKVVIVNGGTEGIGLAIVREFGENGEKWFTKEPMWSSVHEPLKVSKYEENMRFRVVESEMEVSWETVARASSEEKGQAIQRELQTSGCPGQACFQVCDVRKESDIKRMILVTVERYGCLDCLVNNAGTGHLGTIDEMDAQDLRNSMELNAVSCFLASKYALPYLRETKGNIINMASIVGVLGAQYAVLYSSSQGAIIAMTKSLAIDESKYGVRVNSGGAEVGFGKKNQVDLEPEQSTGGNSKGSSSKQ
ncbi:UNVERIFIED_CONTAM: hypothetical protein K2H54_038753 [Gekko kuhli]